MSQLTKEEFLFFDNFKILDDYEIRHMNWNDKYKYNQDYMLYQVLKRKWEGISIEEYMESRKEEFQNNIEKIIRR